MWAGSGDRVILDIETRNLEIGKTLFEKLALMGVVNE